MTHVRFEGTFAGWQAAARWLLHEQVRPHDVQWEPAGTVTEPEAAASERILVPRQFIAAASAAAEHPHAEKWAVMYRVLWRITHGERDLLTRNADRDVLRLLRLAREADERNASRTAASSAQPFVPRGAAVEQLRAAAARCEGCDLFRRATRTVFGEGPSEAQVMLVGEQPGHQEDLAGRPFVGPAGELLDRALKQAGFRRDDLYVTNAVKHFKFEPRGPRRIHKTPDYAEIQACHPWLEAELATIRPRLVICLGSTAGQALMGPDFRVMKSRGRIHQSPWASGVLATIHPSAVLRADTPDREHEMFHLLVSDLRVGVEWMERFKGS
jgi:uracil-DNA glycosylase